MFIILKPSLGILILLSFLLFFPASKPTVSGLIVFNGESARLDVYVLALDGVSAGDVDNASRVVEGVQSAAGQLNRTGFWYHYNQEKFGPPYEWHEYLKNISVHTNFSVVKDWHTYGRLVETEREPIIVNAHGETLPVPADYTKEEWADKIAEAMLYRNLTWIHMAGYPLFSAWHEGSSEPTPWGEGGFKHLMSHIGKGHVTCWSPPRGETVKVSLHPDAEDTLDSIGGWGALDTSAAYVYCSRPLNSSDFKDYCVLKIYGEVYYVGAVIAFTGASNNTKHGFYVHLGTAQTFDTAANPTDRDYYRGYVAAAAGMWANIARKIAEAKLQEAQLAVSQAQSEGRTKGLGGAISLLNEAKQFYSNYKYSGTIRYSYSAIEAAEKAMEPSLIEKALPLIYIAGIITLVVCANIIWKRNQK